MSRGPDRAVSAFLRAVVAPAWAVKERSPYLRIAARLAREDRLPAEFRRERQWRALREILAHAASRIPFYRDRFAAIGFEPGDLRSPSDLALLPLLTKKDVRTHAASLTDSPPRDDWVRKRTSGSTGVSLFVYTDEACMQRRRGITLSRDRWTGWDVAQPRAMVWGNPPVIGGIRARLRAALLERDFYLDTLRLDRERFLAFAGEIRRRRPTLLFGHAHSLYLLARFWEQEGLPDPGFRGMISTAMVLHEHERAGIERVFGKRLFDRYGCEEVSLMASECEAHAGLHVNTDGVLIELIEDRSGVPPKVVVTDLLNRAMPMIRYEVGDRATAIQGICPCGRTHERLGSVAGRVADYLYTPRGDLVSGISLTENFATLIPGVEQVQVVQERRDHLHVNLVPAPEFDDESRKRIGSLIAERFGGDMHYDVEIRERIDPEPSGKFRFAICRVPESDGVPAASSPVLAR